jgi:hypothetical protein
MTFKELANFVLKTYPDYFELGTDDNSIIIKKSLFPSFVFVEEEVIIKNLVNFNLDMVDFNELVTINGLHEGGIPYLTTYKLRTLDLDSLNEFMVGMSMDFLVPKLQNLQLQLKDYEMKLKMKKLNEDF